MAKDWQLALQERVQSNRYIPMPDSAREVVGMDHPLEGPSVFWNYERHSNYVVLSRESLAGDNYVDVGRYRMYDADGDGTGVRIRPPEGLSDVVASSFETGERVMYLAYESMTTGANPSVYLLSTAQLLRGRERGHSDARSG